MKPNRFALLALFAMAVPAAYAQTYCQQTGATRTASTISAADRETILKLHNDERKLFNNPPLVWDDTVAQFAQGWANAMAVANDKKLTGNWSGAPHTKGSCYPKADGTEAYGENIGGGNDVPSSVKSWLAEKADYDLPSRACKKDGAVSKMCGHYVAVVSRLSTVVGCGYNVKSGLICNYNPMGALVTTSGYRQILVNQMTTHAVNAKAVAYVGSQELVVTVNANKPLTVTLEADKTAAAPTRLQGLTIAGQAIAGVADVSAFPGEKFDLKVPAGPAARTLVLNVKASSPANKYTLTAEER